MAQVRKGTIGILPAGALGVSLFFHLTRGLSRIDGDVFFIERSGSTSGELLRQQKFLRVAVPATAAPGDAESETTPTTAIGLVPAREILKGDLLECFEKNGLPEILLICPNPDQLLSVITTIVALLEKISQRGELQDDASPLPIMVLSSNGIYFQRVRQIFVEKLEEATLFGRLPDLWPDLMPKIVGRLLRGITIQTGIREGSGAETIYHPGARGITRLAGGDKKVREYCCAILAGRGAWFELAEHESPTRLEFDKAIVNLAANFLGQLYAIDDAGDFRLLTVEQILADEHQAAIEELAARVFEVGKSVKAYHASERFETILQNFWGTVRVHASHIPSSLQWLNLLLRQKKLKPQLTPTEAWLIDPLIRYARSAHLEEASEYFQKLKQRLIRKLELAIRRAD